MTTSATTRQTIERYFEALSARGAWERFMADDVRFVSHVMPKKEALGRDAFVASTRGFYSMIRDLEIRQLIVDGPRACALTSYRLQPPSGAAFTCEVAEAFDVGEAGIETFEIYFDSAPFARPPA
ncbi:MAG: nuclear transport factor 2 family protein [Sandaracinaceae bacterium]